MPVAPADAKAAKRWFKIPARSANPERSGIQEEIAAPATVKEFELVD
jgi:hypothetical protein